MYKSFKKPCLILLSALFAVMLVLACAFMLSPKTTAHADAEDCSTGVVATVTFNGEVTEYDDIQDAWTYANYVDSSNDTPAVIKLLADVETKHTLSKNGSKVITLDLNGCILKYTGTSRANSVIYLSNEGKFTLKDSNPNSTHYYTDNNGLWEFGETGTEFKGGVLTGGDINGSGGGVRTFGEFVMESGSICGNKSSNGGGGVFVGATGVFTMYGGSICGNTAGNNGGGVNVFDDGLFTVAGAPLIFGNKKTDNSNANVNLAGNHKITVTGELTEGAKIGVSNTGAFTSGYGENNKDASNNIIAPDKYFISDNVGYYPTLENEEVVLVEGVATVTVDSVETRYGSIQDAWTYANNATTAATVKMFADATVSSTLEIAEGNNITLDLNGHMLKYSNDAEEGSVIKVFKSTFTLIDSNNTTPHTITNPVTNEEVMISGGLITGGSAKGGVWVDGGTFTMNGGTISGNTNGRGVQVESITKYNEETHGYDVVAAGTFIMNGGVISGNTAGGVEISGGTFEMNDGTISGNATTYFGGGVAVGRGTFEMNGGTISENTANDGGGVCVAIGTFTMENGTISGNTASDQGGGVFVYSNSTFTMNGGTISENTANDGGGVNIYTNSTFTMNGGAISDNTASKNGGGVNVYSNCTFTMTGGTISENTATNSGSYSGNGGGAYVYIATFEMTGGTISENAAINGGGLYVTNFSNDYNTTFKLSGGAISGNAAETAGGGVYVGNYVDFKTSGEPKITGNKKGSIEDGTVNNLCLYEGVTVTVTGALTEGAIIGVNTMGDVATGFTHNGTDKASKYFIPDNPEKCAYLSDETSGTVTVGTHIFAEDFTVDTPATCTEAGSKSKHCTHCDEKSEVTEIPATGHTLTHHEATAATEEKDGNTEYWSCDECGNYFSDETGETIISDKSSVTLPKLTPDNNGGETGNGGLSACAIAGIVIGIIIFLIIVEYFVCYFVLYRKGILSGKFFDVIYVPMNAICGKKNQDEQDAE